MKTNVFLSICIATIPLWGATPPEAMADEIIDGVGNYWVLDDKAPSDLQQMVSDFQEKDKDAQFTFAGGHVDGFATSPKKSIPKYALPTLNSLGLSTKAVTPTLIPTSVKEEKPSQDLDADITRQLPYMAEEEAYDKDDYRYDDEPEGPFDDEKPVEENRKQEAIWLEEKPADWKQPSDAELKAQRPAALPILTAFLQEHHKLFEIDSGSLKAGMPQLELEAYSVARYFRRAVFSQYNQGERILDGKVLVLYDYNWNVINISKMINTDDKYKVDLSDPIRREMAAETAAQFLEDETGYAAGIWMDIDGERGIEWVRKQQVWELRMVVPEETDMDYTVRIHAQTNKVVNHYSNVDYYTDAEFLRWSFPGGEKDKPTLFHSTNQYTRSSRSLVHDFFYIANDERGTSSQWLCAHKGEYSKYQWQAYGDKDSSEYIRPTIRTDRDWTAWHANASSGTFAETQTYYWARYFVQWMKPTLRDLGVLPNNSADYPRALIVTNACLDRGIASHSSSYEVSTLDNVGEGIPVIRLWERCRQSGMCFYPTDWEYGGDSFVSCQGEGCYTTPSVIHHEFNHFFLKKYFGVGSGIDCDSGNQLKFLHEGILGSAVPQAYWHHYYGVGYNPSTDRLYKAEDTAGLVHVDEDSELRLSDYLCHDSEDGPYTAGRVAGQPLWEIFHGRRATSNGNIVNMGRPSNDTYFLTLAYLAAEMTDASSLKRRADYAREFMEAVDLYTLMPESTKMDWCSVWSHHHMGAIIPESYCH